MAQNVIRNQNTIFLRVGNDWYRYDEQAKVGEGSMGVVYCGYHCQTNQRVAVKMVREQYASVPSIRQRAYLEAQLQFRHNHLIGMLGYCEMAPGRGPLWIISQLVQGITIDLFLEDYNRRDFDQLCKICHIFTPVFDALEYLHEKKVIHLDIKPSNIMVENGRNVRLMDLGIASAGDSSHQNGHSIMGTPNYAAPEQFEKDGVLDEQTDVYQTAVTLYELLTKKNPYRRENLQDTITAHKNGSLPPSNLLTNEFNAVFSKATSPNKESRYKTIREFREAIYAAMEVKPSGIKGSTVIIVILVILFLIFIVNIILLLNGYY